ncbi:MAG: monovalent cation/H+ antiporter subunit D [Polymorphobacter sp.]|uniref:monovalent cation/H+ antiporter subunit D n=1 Tax=Polymorphobacter sp. TaxID=1909290 RepID=UPI003A85C8C1
MSAHLPVLPILLPFVAALLMMVVRGLAVQRGLALASSAASLMVVLALLVEADSGAVSVYRLGDWPAPYGIVLVVDRLAALMVALVAGLGLAALLMALGGQDAAGRHFHPLFQLQLAGLAGAFLTGDLFNLFVFFEILLLASYALFMHGGLDQGEEPARLRAGLIYVILNLLGSSLFLIALALVYASLGTLNLADVAQLLPGVGLADAALVRAAMALMAVVFLLKAAVLPVSLWLPQVYARAPAAAAALFAVLTKLGAVMLLRLAVSGWGEAPVMAGLLMPWLPALALGTVALGTAGLFAARRLGEVAGWLVLISSGTVLFGVAFAGPKMTAALLYYLVQSTLVGGGLFLLVGHVAARRGLLGDRLVRGPAVFDREWLLPAWGVLAIGLAGLPPFSGFIGKLMLLQGIEGGWRAAWWAVLLTSGVGVLVVFSRCTGMIFWQAGTATPDARPHEMGVAGLAPRAGLWLLVAAGPLLALAAAPVAGYAARTAAQLHGGGYGDAVLGPATVLREGRP